MDYTIHYFISWKTTEVIANSVLNEDYKLLETLKESTRSMVYLIQIGERSLILKEPVEKNTSKWIRFTTLMRKSEAFQSCMSMSVFHDIGVETNQPLVVIEKKKAGMVVNSWYVCSYVDGDSCDKENYPAVVDTLNKIHNAGYLHGDPQIRNFLKGKKGIQVIDMKISKHWNPIQRQLELVYLNNSAPETGLYIDKSIISYTIAEFIMNSIQKWFRKSKQKIRQIFKS